MRSGEACLCRSRACRRNEPYRANAAPTVRHGEATPANDPPVSHRHWGFDRKQKFELLQLLAEARSNRSSIDESVCGGLLPVKAIVSSHSIWRERTDRWDSGSIFHFRVLEEPGASQV